MARPKTATKPQAQSKAVQQFNLSQAMKSVQALNQEARAKGTTPRDLMTQPLDEWSAPPEIKRSIVIHWFSDIMIQRKGISPGYARDIWKPVTQKEIDEFGLEFVTRQRAANGQPQYGHDAYAFWTTRELYAEQCAANRSTFDTTYGNKGSTAEMEERLAREMASQGFQGSRMEGEIRKGNLDLDADDIDAFASKANQEAIDGFEGDDLGDGFTKIK